MQLEYLVVTHTGSFVAVDPATSTFTVTPGFLHRDGRPLLGCDAELRPCIMRGDLSVLVEDLSICDPVWTDGICCAGLQRDGHYGSVHPAGGDIKFDRDERKSWENFQIIRHSDIAAIHDFAHRSWLLVDENSITTPSLQMMGSSFHLGGRSYGIDDNIGVFRDLLPHDKQVILTRQEYCIDRLISYKPLIYYVCFGNDAQFSLLNASLESLIDLGRYDGDLCVITDRRHLDDWIPKNFKGNIHIIHKKFTKREEFRCARYDLGDVKDISSYGPILYMDTDVCVIEDISIILHRICLSKDICVGKEQYSTTLTKPPSLLNVAESVGSKLFHRDGCDPGYQFGFNSGIMGFPSISVTAEPFRRVITTIKCRAQTGEVLQFVDQPVANYVFYKLGVVDTKTLSGFIQVGTANRTYSYISPNEVQVLIHFWGIGMEQREKAMRSHISFLRAGLLATKGSPFRQYIPINI